MSVSTGFHWVFGAVLFVATTSVAFAYNECSVRNACGQCSATCNQQAFCAAGELDATENKCTRQARCLCLGAATMKRVDALISRKPMTMP